MTTAAASDGAISVALLGASGRVGSRLLELLAAREAAGGRDGAPLRIVAALNSRAGFLARAGVPAGRVLDRLAAAAPGSAAAVRAALAQRPAPQVIVDCTASAEVAACYPAWLAAGSDVVAANKHGPAADRPLARAIAAARAASGAALHDAATVGAQLPLLATLRELHAAGDRVAAFEAVLSGTLSYVLGRVQEGTALSAAVREAVGCGYAEPHPASDLSGMDAARKLVILLRACGHDVELADIERVPLVEDALLAEPAPERLLARLAALDGTWRARAAIADARRERWIYRASFADGRARVAPEAVPAGHPLARLAPCENALILRSRYYHAAPLTIAGPGAGVDLTAAAVLADLLAAAARHAVPRVRLAAPSAAALA
jgi:homoserine dehydrogenase